MKNVKAVSLFYKEGSSDKVYHAQLMETDGGFVVNFQYGRRNSTLQTGSKTASPVDKPKAEKVFEKLVSEKMSKGYTAEETGEIFSTEEFKSKKTDILPQLLNAISEEEAKELLSNDSFVAQEKHDGERRLVIIKEGKATGVNRKGLEVQLPDVVSKSFKKDMIVDGEIVGDKMFLFDILSLDGESLKGLSLSERLDFLGKEKFGKNVSVTKTAFSTKDKKTLLKKIQDSNGEGIVFKDKNKDYTSGRPNKGGAALKYKFYKTATFIVASHTKEKRSVGLVVLKGNKEVEVGKVTILPNFAVPAVGSLVEVQYLYAYEGGAVFQPVYLGERLDLERNDATIEQLIYKRED